MNKGRIVQVVGPVVDVEFTEKLPDIYSALTVDFKVANEPFNLILEVQQHLGDHWVRTISMSGTEGLKRGYDAIDTGYGYLLQQNRGKEDSILAVVVLTDGEDTDSKLPLEELMQHIRYDGENRKIHVFTIAYGKGAKKAILKQIAESTQAKTYEGTPENIVEVFKDISTFF